MNDAGDKILWESPCYTIKYSDHDGRRVKVATRTPDKDDAQQLANELEAKAMRRRSGLIDATQERFATEARRLIAEHLAEYRGYLQAKGNTPKHVCQTCRHIELIAQECHAQHVRELSGAAVLRVLGERRDAGTSLRTCNSQLRSVQSFTRWLWKEKRTPDDALAGLSAFNAETDRRQRPFCGRRTVRVT